MKEDAVLITGGARGIGAGIARRLSADGYAVIVLDLVEPDAGFSGDYIKVDLANVEAVGGVLNKVVKTHSITRLVNNVGIVRPASIEDTRLEDFTDVINLNARTALMCLQAVLPAMRKAGFGRVVSITSRVVLGKENRTAYSASKGALGAMTRTWALELAGDGITVNAVAPGPIETETFVRNNPPNSPRTQAVVERIPVNRLGAPKDVAQAVSFFLDARSGFITGHTLYVDGGLSAGLASI
jgi:3-oxoacyl-[acyl-carrier protein] reductase